jgi:hypothetical protein
MKRVLVVVNKSWECDPVLSVLRNEYARPLPGFWPESVDLSWPTLSRPDWEAALAPAHPRQAFVMRGTAIEVWCISDLLRHFPDRSCYQSSTERKAEVLGKAFAGEPPALVVAVGTAGFPGDRNENGNVVIGTRAFIYNAHAGGQNADSNWTGGPMSEVIDSGLDESLFSDVTHIAGAKDQFLVPPLNPADSPRVLAAHAYVGISVVNVTDYAEYGQTDRKALDSFSAQSDPSPPMSLETTHGLIRCGSDAPFMFVSGIADRVGHFDEDVRPRPYAQNTAASHNAGVAVAWVLSRVSKALA